jgi:phosphodiesterase/alkaline phosphatase D-like protein
MTTTQRNTILLGLGGILLLVAGAAAYYIPRMNDPVETYVATETSSPTSDTGSATTSGIVQGATTQGKAPVAITSKDPDVSETAASLSGTVRPNGFYTTYWFEYGTTQGFGSRSSPQSIGSGYQTLKATGFIKSLSRNTKYYYRLVAENEIGKAIGTTYSFQTESGSAPIGGLPKLATTAASDIATSSATISGEVTPNQTDTTYWFEYGKTRDFGQVTSVKSAGAGLAKVNVSSVITDLAPDTTYYYRINAQNRFGTANGQALTFTTAKIPKPTHDAPTVDTQSADNVATSSVLLRGRVNPEGLETTYWFEYSTDSLLGSVLLKSTSHKTLPAGNDFTSVNGSATDLSPDTKYYYRVVAQNSTGVTYGDKVTFKTD